MKKLCQICIILITLIVLGNFAVDFVAGFKNSLALRCAQASAGIPAATMAPEIYNKLCK
jgi:hypothetical protein